MLGRILMLVGLMGLFSACGKDGADGINGLQGPAGPAGVAGATGLDGRNGVDGNAGADGLDGLNALVSISDKYSSDTGSSCFLVSSGMDLDRNNTLDLVEVTSAQELCDGLAGEQGIQGETGVTTVIHDPIEIIDPCGNAAGIYDEVILELSEGIFIASFSDNSSGKNTRFSVLVDGNYVTTDGSNCHFSVSNGQISW